MVSEQASVVDKLNDLYHEGLNGDKVEQKSFTDYVAGVRKAGVKFCNVKPSIVFENIPLNEYENKLYEKLQLILSEKENATKHELWRYQYNLAEVESGLLHELSTLLMKRGAIGKKYFWKLSSGNIAFNWSGHTIDLAVWWEEKGIVGI